MIDSSSPVSAVPPVGAWQQSTVVGIRTETPSAKTFRLRLSVPTGYLAGQHFVFRLTAPDGYTASRSYSVASAPDASSEIELTVERLDDGEVSAFLHDEVVVGDQLEVRGPIGQWFVWQGDTSAVLIGGGSGVVPLMSMLRLARRTGREDLVHLVASVRFPEDLYYAAEMPGPNITAIYTRGTPEGWPRPAGRMTAEDLPGSAIIAIAAYVCGSAGFSDAATAALVDRGVPTDRIRVERFGPTG